MKPPYLTKMVVYERVRNSLRILEGSPLSEATLELANVLIKDVLRKTIEEQLVLDPPEIEVSADHETGTLYISWPKDWMD